jgi:hypothetical protein
MSTVKTNFFIVDFTASKRYYHQYPLITGLATFLLESGFRSHILMPVIADRDDIMLASRSLSFILDSGYSSFSKKPLRHLLHKMLLALSGDKNLSGFLKGYLRKLYIKSALKFFKKNNIDSNTRIIFPNLDPLSFELALAILKIPNIAMPFIYFRITGSESRGTLSSKDELKKLLRLVQIYPKNIMIGIETVGYKSYLENLGFESNSISWSPWPYMDNFDKTIPPNKKLIIGFLGCAKQRKGFDNIPKILEYLKNDGLDFDVLIQEANFPWPNYSKSKREIELIMGDNFKFLSSNLELTDLQYYINICNLLILPYDIDSYSINASGILYHAADSKVPILTAKGVGFESEIVEFNLGLIYNSFSEIPMLVRKIQTINLGFDDYNLKRNQATQVFLCRDYDNHD